MQIRREGEGCDRIYRMPVVPDVEAAHPGLDSTTAPPPAPTSSRAADLLYASTHLAGDACPPRPDMSQGYVWALYDSYDIFTRQAGRQRPAAADQHEGLRRRGHGVRPRRLDHLHLHPRRRPRAVPDGQGRPERQAADPARPATTAAPSSTPTARRSSGAPAGPGPARSWTTTRRLLAQGLVRPSKLEIWVANADGNEAMQLTNLDAASFAPSFHPTEDVIVFSSNFGDPRGREFDLWAMRTDGSGPAQDHPRARLRRVPPLLARRPAAGVLVQPGHRPRARTTPTCSWPAGRAWARCPPRPRARPTASGATCTGWPTRPGRGAASARPAWSRRGPTWRTG